MIESPAFGGVAPAELARAYGTPLLVIDTDELDRAIGTFERLAGKFALDVAYAGKALLFDGLARRIARSALSLDVCSLGELLTAERAGMPADRLVFHGCGKTLEELHAAADGRVGRVVVDHIDELHALVACARADAPVKIVLRVNTGIEADTHAYVRTGGEESKFGFAIESLEAAVRTALAAPGVRLVGLHSHIGSQIFEGAPYAASLGLLLDAYGRTRAAGAPLDHAIVGGGFGVSPYPGGEAFDLESTFTALATELAEGSRSRGFPAPRLGIEPGRAIIAAAGTSLYRVAAVKRQGARRFAIVDGGIADNPRPALYGAYHHPELVGRSSTVEPVEFTICGRSCENDRLVAAELPGDLATGDLVSFGTAGAYTYSMASNYNRFPRPAVAFAGGGSHRLMVRRESVEEIISRDVVDS